MSRYSVNPLEQNFLAWDQSSKKKRNDYWRRLRLAMSDFKYKDVKDYNFKNWMLVQWGLEIELDENGSYTSNYFVIDDKKYMLFMLKYV
jgi:hypothetical protein